MMKMSPQALLKYKEESETIFSTFTPICYKIPRCIWPNEAEPEGCTKFEEIKY